jgi:hypothetical protein
MPGRQVQDRRRYFEQANARGCGFAEAGARAAGLA